MAAEALKKSAAALGYEIKVETQGSVGAKNRLTDEEIERADAVIIAADAYVDTARFAGKRLFQTADQGGPARRAEGDRRGAGAAGSRRTGGSGQGPLAGRRARRRAPAPTST